jgi:hypothetical protein
MDENAWIREFPAAVTVCDPSGIILEMNGRSRAEFEADGGEKLIGRSVLDCHPEPSRTKLKTMMDERRANIYRYLSRSPGTCPTSTATNKKNKKGSNLFSITFFL